MLQSLQYDKDLFSYLSLTYDDYNKMAYRSFERV